MLDFFHVCVHVCVYVHAHVHTSTCVCQRTTLSDVLRDSINSFEIGFSQAWSAEIKLANKFQEPPLSLPPHHWDGKCNHHDQHQIWGL